ncbi:GCN20-type ATP-binding cassette protein GCN3, putative [Entamoeba invadens IP1]|uniref:GCN20-type ATP-binding cassette protein GCN3, putative n=1 Tax=Entamoeba invadens IP1 TaxID=370355 RepID=A0A0A1TZ48_ENTIV|nr:GCN20-type ATP-binding cassette protein GCN3, putative [Entamoeba invadens IP1]ELP86855.1 GCN20-type ATP-binding cassette protein GCN3, putative [Entamoeba invadens IP1]|eukprot:XP_004253626.1 GCN20-type ATP-binding cassette protein GCN3, putative [Entamoeba invadens IP1]
MPKKEKVKRVKGEKSTKKSKEKERAAEATGGMVVDDNGEVKFNSRSANAAIVSVGKQGDTPHAWPDYVFLKGTSFSSKNKDKARDIKIDNFTLQVPGKVLLNNSTLTMGYGSKYGLVGKNGIGKSVLMCAISGREAGTPFANIPANIRILHVQQEVPGNDLTPLDTVLQADVERIWLLSEEKRLLSQKDEHHEEEHESSEEHAEEHIEPPYDINDIYDRMKEIEVNKAEPRALKILKGLGFQEDEMRKKKTSEYSGGWRMRIALATALYLQPDLLILDEPTNHLDLNAVIWLEHYLMGWKKSLLLVSHDTSFLNNVCDHIVHFTNQTLTSYRGDYASFLKALEMKQNQEEKKKRIEKAENQKAKKKGEEKKKEKTQLTKQEKAVKELEGKAPVFEFPDPGDFETCAVQFDEVSFKYDTAKTEIFRDLQFGIYMKSRIGLVGPNGTGKSTLMKLIDGELKETTGYVDRNRQLRIGRFHQHHVDDLPMDLSSIEYMQKSFPSAQIQEIRQFLGRFGLKGDTPKQRIETLSGGQKSRLVFAEICWKKPHLLLLDEPTNHLDADSIESLIDGLKNFGGGLLLISHHQHMIEAATDEIWVVKGNNTVEKFDGDFNDYKQMLLKGMDFGEEEEDK